VRHKIRRSLDFFMNIFLFEKVRECARHSESIASNIIKLVVGIAILVMSFTEVKAQPPLDITFDTSNFRVILSNNTSFYNYPGTYKYTLTGFVNNQAVAMWHRDTLDIREDFVFNFRIYFDEGVSPSQAFGSGIVFSMYLSQ
jgi:hypothetical protein